MACRLHVLDSSRHRGKPCGAYSMYTFIDDTPCRVHHLTTPRYMCSQTHTYQQTTSSTCRDLHVAIGQLTLTYVIFSSVMYMFAYSKL